MHAALFRLMGQVQGQELILDLQNAAIGVPRLFGLVFRFLLVRGFVSLCGLVPDACAVRCMLNCVEEQRFMQPWRNCHQSLTCVRVISRVTKCELR